MNTKNTLFAVLACSTIVGSTAFADLMWDEAIDGDLSGDYMNPTQLYTKVNLLTYLYQRT